LCNKAAANKLKAELEAYGCPPVFPTDNESETTQKEQSAEAIIQAKGESDTEDMMQSNVITARF